MRWGWLLLLAGCAGLRVVPLPPEAERHRPKTKDGWEIALVRYRPQGPVTGRPVLLCHGISANDRNMDLDERHSMARWFAAQGREAWTMSLRATGDSDRPDPSKGRALPIFFDDYWEHDLPTAIAHVRAVTGAESIDYAGHSMGGMIAYAYLSQGGTGLHAVATLGAPTRLDWGTGLEAILARLGPKVVSSPDVLLPSQLGAGLAAPFMTVVRDGPFQRIFYNPESTDPSTWQRLVVYGTADTAGGTARQLLALIATGRFTSKDGARDFRADMARIRTPVLVVAGKLDRVALTPAVMDGYGALGGPKRWLLITRANGALGEYGHMDLVIGERAPDEVFRPVLDFFNLHDPP
ncbi:MAG: alpha/beta fold hydrolase [Myxococcaceae bacterium]|jgi:polyhydroxyalkanoate synthase|nr:alpha/beta fold hydrolase [Myxococcaceae bacterium]